MDFLVLFYYDLDDVFHLVNTHAMFSLELGKVENIEFATFLEGFVNHCVKLLVEAGESISVLVSKEDTICNNNK